METKSFICMAEEATEHLTRSQMYEIAKTVASELGTNSSEVRIFPLTTGKNMLGEELPDMTLMLGEACGMLDSALSLMEHMPESKGSPLVVKWRGKQTEIQDYLRVMLERMRPVPKQED